MHFLKFRPYDLIPENSASLNWSFRSFFHLTERRIAMKKTRYTEEQIAFALKQAETGTRVGEVCRKMGISEPTFYNYGLPPFCKYWIWFWVVAYIYPASGKSVPKWVIRTQSPQQLDGLWGQYKNQVPIVQVQPVIISQYTATFAGRGLISHYLILGIISQHRPDYSRVFVSAIHRNIKRPSSSSAISARCNQLKERCTRRLRFGEKCSRIVRCWIFSFSNICDNSLSGHSDLSVRYCTYLPVLRFKKRNLSAKERNISSVPLRNRVFSALLPYRGQALKALKPSWKQSELSGIYLLQPHFLHEIFRGGIALTIVFFPWIYSVFLTGPDVTGISVHLHYPLSKSWLLIVIHNRHRKCADPESSFTMNQTRTRALSAGCMKMLNKFIRIELYADPPHQVNKKIVSIELINQSGDNIKRAFCMLRYAAFGYHRPSSSLRQGRAFIRTVSESVCSHSGITLIIREVAIQESPPFRSGIHTTFITTLRSHWYRSAGRMVNHDFHHVTQITIKKKLILPPDFYRLPVDNSFWGLYPCSFRILIYTALIQKDYILIYSHYQPHIQNHIPDCFFLTKSEMHLI